MVYVMGKKITKRKLTLKQEKFCQVYVSPDEFFGNGVQSYMKAYGLEFNKKNLASARANAYKLLTNAHILRRIDELLEIDGFNDQQADKTLAFLMTQKAELGTSLGATKEYNKLKGRITDKIEHKGLVLKIESDNPKDQKSIDSIS